MKRLVRLSILPLAISGFIVLFWLLLKDVTIDVLQPTGQIAQEQRTLLIFTLALSALVVLPVFTLLSIFAYKYREGRGADYTPEQEGSYKLEALWWGIPIIIIFVLALITWSTSNSLDPYKKIESNNETVSVQVVALQWKWLFIYPDHGVASVNELPMPVDHPVHFKLAADAPMSAFWIPSLGSQVYSMNGMSSELNLIANKIGEYKGYNTNINGQGYAEMQFTARVPSYDEFERWVEQTRTSEETLTMNNYETLANPDTIEEPLFYRLGDTQLYDKILAKYMHSMPHTPDQPETHDHSMHQHGGH